MIAVIGTPRLRGTGSDADVAGLAAAIAAAAAAAGSRVELIGKLGDDSPGDAVLLALARHFLTGDELTATELERLIERAVELKADRLGSRTLEGRSVALVSASGRR